MIDPIARGLGVLSIVGGAAATVAAAVQQAPPPVFLAQLRPAAAAEWVPVIANAIPAIGGAMLLLYANWRQTRRKIAADDDKARAESLQARLDAMTAERDKLAAKLAETEKS